MSVYAFERRLASELIVKEQISDVIKNSVFQSGVVFVYSLHIQSCLSTIFPIFLSRLESFKFVLVSYIEL